MVSTSSHLIETSQEYGADHARDVKAQPSKEACTFQSDVRSPDDQGLPRRSRHGEYVVTGDSVLLSSGYVRVAWPAAWKVKEEVREKRGVRKTVKAGPPE